MRAFVFHLHNDARAVQTFELEVFACASDAIAHARDLLVRNARFRKVVVVEGATEVAQLHRGEVWAAARPAWGF